MYGNGNDKKHYDFVVVGARCAGASVGLLLARAGASVLIIDRQEYGSDRLSTHALMRGAVMQLHRWGVLEPLIAEGTPKIQLTTFHYGAESFPIDIKPDGDIDCLIAPRRTVLDRVLVDAARNAGAVVRHGVTLTDLMFSRSGRVTGVAARDADGHEMEIHAGMVIGADGRQSRVADLVKAEIYRQGNHSASSVYGYFDNLANDGTNWYFAEHSAAGAIPTNDGQSCVFASVPAHRFSDTFRNDQMGGFKAIVKANSASLAASVENATLSGKLRGFAGSPGFFRKSYGNGWALVGDAGYFKDPVTAHGITDALRDAGLLAGAVLSSNANALALYQAQRDVLSNELFSVTDEIASFDWNLQSVQVLHHRLSKAMKAECEFLAGDLGDSKLAA